AVKILPGPRGNLATTHRMNALGPSVEVRRFQSGDVTIVVDAAGPPDGAPVILLHGGGQTRSAWGGALAEGARRGFHMISADLRAPGESGWAPDAHYGMDAHARDIAAIAGAHHMPPFLVGASLGGMASLSYAAMGGRLAGLVLVDIAPTVNTTGTDK